MALSRKSRMLPTIAGAMALALAAGAGAQTTIPGAAIRRDSMRPANSAPAQRPAASAPGASTPTATGPAATSRPPQASPSRLGIPGTARRDATVARGIAAAAPAIMRRRAETAPATPFVESDRLTMRPGDRAWGGRLALDRLGRPYALPGRDVPVALIDPKVLESGDKVAIARMLRPAVDLGYLSQYDQFVLGNIWRCGEDPGCPRSDPTPYAFAPDAYSQGDPNRAGMIDPFVRSGNSPVIQTAAPTEDPEAGLTGYEKAANRLYDGEPEAAVVLLRSYTDAHPGDADAFRALAVALIDARRVKDGVELMGRVYHEHPELAASAIPADSVGPERELRDLVIRVVEHAHKVNTSAAWLTAAMLMQAEGRNEPALKMIERAETSGLSSEVAAAMRGALKP